MSFEFPKTIGISIMKIALIQHKINDDHEACVQRALDASRQAASNGAELIAFPELAFTPFYPQCPAEASSLELAEPVNGDTVRRFQDLAKELEVVFVLNIFEREGDRAFDSSPVIDKDGSILGVTRMVHITDYEGFHEQGYYTPGDSGAPVYETAIGKIGVAICYDRHYPEYLRLLALNGAELVVVPQAGTVGEWPDGLYEAELQVGSFQNGYFMALANRVGQDGKLEFGGGSFVTSPNGKVVAQSPFGEEDILYAEIDLAECESSHARKLFLRDRRPEVYTRLSESKD